MRWAFSCLEKNEFICKKSLKEEVKVFRPTVEVIHKLKTPVEITEPISQVNESNSPIEVTTTLPKVFEAHTAQSQLPKSGKAQQRTRKVV